MSAVVSTRPHRVAPNATMGWNVVWPVAWLAGDVTYATAVTNPPGGTSIGGASSVKPAGRSADASANVDGPHPVESRFWISTLYASVEPARNVFSGTEPSNIRN